jgi:A/G-specific adenine glycosylase
MDRHGGALPDDEPSLLKLPGVGAYTAAAVAAIAFGRRTFALDGNAARVVARVAAVGGAVDGQAARARLRAIGEGWVPARRAGDFAQAVMELGAMVCTPRAPSCAACPLGTVCAARATGRAEALPEKTARPRRRLVRLACARVRHAGRLLLVRRRAGLLAGTWLLPAAPIEPPATTTTATATAAAATAARAAVRVLGLTPAAAVTHAGSVRHVFTHRDVTAEVFDVPARASRARGGGDRHEDVEMRWVDEGRLGGLAVSTFLRKLLAASPGAAAPMRPIRRAPYLLGDKLGIPP